jgi:glycosyltransferase involved in cell wall biosynthesis
MKILWVKANKILPVHSGGDIRSFNIVRQLAKQDEVIFLSYYDGPRDREYEEELGKQLPGSVCVCTGKRNDSAVARGLDYMFRVPSPIPYAVSRFESARVQKKLEQCIAEAHPDIAICDFLDAAINFPRSLNVRSVLFQHNVESEIWRRHAETCTSLLRRQVYELEFAKMLRYEREMVRRFDHVIAVSEHDRTLMSAWTDSAQISVVPTGVDLARFKPEENAQPAGPLAVFVGAMDWPPNVDAVEYFCNEVWPSVQAKLPGAQFRIVGRNPGPRIQKLASASIRVTGSVPSVVEHLREAAVVVVPLRIGGGTRLKIYEAMAAGKAVVSTSIGAEGLDVKHGSDICLADDAGAFTTGVVTFLQDSAARHSLELAAAATAAQHDWSAVAMKFRQILQTVRTAARAQKVVELATAG